MAVSRHVNAILTTVAPDFVCAIAEGFGIGVAVTYRELITARARVLRRPRLRRYRLGEVSAVRIRRGRSVNLLLVEVGTLQPTTLMVLYGIAAADAFDAIAAALDRRCPRLANHRRQLRRHPVSTLSRSAAAPRARLQGSPVPSQGHGRSQSS